MDETDARARIHEIADQIPPSVPPFEELLADGRRRKHRGSLIRSSAATVFSSAAVVAAISVGSSLLATHPDNDHTAPAAPSSPSASVHPPCPTSQTEARGLDTSSDMLNPDPSQIRVCEINPAGSLGLSGDPAIIDPARISGIIQIINDEARSDPNSACPRSTQAEFVLLVTYPNNAVRAVQVVTHAPCDMITVGSRRTTSGGTRLLTALQDAAGGK